MVYTIELQPENDKYLHGKVMSYDVLDLHQEVCFVGRYFTLAGYMWPLFNSLDNND